VGEKIRKDLAYVLERTIEMRIHKVVGPAGNSGRIYLPKDWVGKKVKTILLGSLLMRQRR
jgi:putative transposon-encoded protein